MSDNAGYPRISELSEKSQPPWATIALEILQSTNETVGGTVSRKVWKTPPPTPKITKPDDVPWSVWNRMPEVKAFRHEYRQWQREEGIQPFGNTCPKCSWKGCGIARAHVLGHMEESPMTSWATLEKAAFPRRCKHCRSRAKKWTNALKTFVRLDLLRQERDLNYLRFVTWTHPKWTTIVNVDRFHQERELLKKKAYKQFRNWRSRNKWWISREAIGQAYPECVVTPIWSGFGFDQVQLHFHIHTVLVSEYLDNRPVAVAKWKEDGEEIDLEDSRFQEEWGGIVDVRAVKDYQVKYVVKGEERRGCGKRACMRYLIDYINKQKNWQSSKIGEW